MLCGVPEERSKSPGRWHPSRLHRHLRRLENARCGQPARWAICTFLSGPASRYLPDQERVRRLIRGRYAWQLGFDRTGLRFIRSSRMKGDRRVWVFAACVLVLARAFARRQPGERSVGESGSRTRCLEFRLDLDQPSHVDDQRHVDGASLAGQPADVCPGNASGL